MKITVRMVLWQARLMGRSVREIARNPAHGRELPRLLATRGRGNLHLRLPWLPFRLIDELQAVVGPGTRVFEFGGGGSTLWLLDRGADVVTVEHDQRWAEHLSLATGGERFTLLQRSAADDFTAYVSAMDAYPDDWFDIIVVDGRERARCIAAATAKLRRGGLLIVDDADRVEYAEAMRSTGWPRRDVIGFAPAKPSLAYTAVLVRPRDDG